MVAERERTGSADKGVKNQNGVDDWEKSGCIEIVLPFPPSVNRYWRHVVIAGKGRTIISADGREYKNDVCEAAAASRSAIKAKHRLGVTITLNAPEKRRRDVDNYAKAVFDSLTAAGVWEDDSQVDRLTVIRGGIVKGGSCVVEIKKLGEVHGTR